MDRRLMVPVCKRCRQYPVEEDDEWQSDFCHYCNDRLIEQAQKRKEWDYYHPGQPMPYSETDDA